MELLKHIRQVTYHGGSYIFSKSDEERDTCITLEQIQKHFSRSTLVSDPVRPTFTTTTNLHQNEDEPEASTASFHTIPQLLTIASRSSIALWQPSRATKRAALIILLRLYQLTIKSCYTSLHFIVWIRQPITSVAVRIRTVTTP